MNSCSASTHVFHSFHPHKNEKEISFQDKMKGLFGSFSPDGYRSHHKIELISFVKDHLDLDLPPSMPWIPVAKQILQQLKEKLPEEERGEIDALIKRSNHVAQLNSKTFVHSKEISEEDNVSRDCAYELSKSLLKYSDYLKRQNKNDVSLIVDEFAYKNALFCILVNESGLDKKSAEETAKAALMVMKQIEEHKGFLEKEELIERVPLGAVRSLLNKFVKLQLAFDLSKRIFPAIESFLLEEVLLEKKNGTIDCGDHILLLWVEKDGIEISIYPKNNLEEVKGFSLFISSQAKRFQEPTPSQIQNSVLKELDYESNFGSKVNHITEKMKDVFASYLEGGCREDLFINPQLLIEEYLFVPFTNEESGIKLILKELFDHLPQEEKHSIERFLGQPALCKKEQGRELSSGLEDLLAYAEGLKRQKKEKMAEVVKDYACKIALFSFLKNVEASKSKDSLELAKAALKEIEKIELFRNSSNGYLEEDFKAKINFSDPPPFYISLEKRMERLFQTLLDKENFLIECSSLIAADLNIPLYKGRSWSSVTRQIINDLKETLPREESKQVEKIAERSKHGIQLSERELFPIDFRFSKKERVSRSCAYQVTEDLLKYSAYLSKQGKSDLSAKIDEAVYRNALFCVLTDLSYLKEKSSQIIAKKALEEIERIKKAKKELESKEVETVPLEALKTLLKEIFRADKFNRDDFAVACKKLIDEALDKEFLSEDGEFFVDLERHSFFVRKTADGIHVALYDHAGGERSKGFDLFIPNGEENIEGPESCNILGSFLMNARHKWKFESKVNFVTEKMENLFKSFRPGGSREGTSVEPQFFIKEYLSMSTPRLEEGMGQIIEDLLSFLPEEDKEHVRFLQNAYIRSKKPFLKGAEIVEGLLKYAHGLKIQKKEVLSRIVSDCACKMALFSFLTGLLPHATEATSQSTHEITQEALEEIENIQSLQSQLENKKIQKIPVQVIESLLKCVSLEGVDSIALEKEIRLFLERQVYLGENDHFIDVEAYRLWVHTKDEGIYLSIYPRNTLGEGEGFDLFVPKDLEDLKGLRIPFKGYIQEKLSQKSLEKIGFLKMARDRVPLAKDYFSPFPEERGRGSMKSSYYKTLKQVQIEGSLSDLDLVNICQDVARVVELLGSSRAVHGKLKTDSVVVHREKGGMRARLDNFFSFKTDLNDSIEDEKLLLKDRFDLLFIISEIFNLKIKDDKIEIVEIEELENKIPFSNYKEIELLAEENNGLTLNFFRALLSYTRSIKAGEKKTKDILEFFTLKVALFILIRSCLLVKRRIDFEGELDDGSKSKSEYEYPILRKKAVEKAFPDLTKAQRSTIAFDIRFKTRKEALEYFIKKGLKETSPSTFYQLFEGYKNGVN